MASNGKKENILTSWKEIAAYLDRDVRTCVRWEKRYGLPVHRLERDSKAKVFAYKDQIDAWLADRSTIGNLRPERTGVARLLGRPFRILLGLAALGAALYLLFFMPPNPSSVPTDFHIRGSVLFIVDQSGRELWPFNTRLSDLDPEAAYRRHFQDKNPGADYVPSWPNLLIRDLDGDSRPEVLFSTQTRSENGEGTLFCFNDQGNKLWQFDAGAELHFGGQTFRKEYRILGFQADDYDGDGFLEILVISFHRPSWPCQVALLDSAGRLEGEYWNAGYIMEALAGDIDGDGDKELAISGVNNEYELGCVAVFETGKLRGYSPQLKEAFKTSELPEGGQSAYILFPKSDVAEAKHLWADPVNTFWIHGDSDGLTAVTTAAQLFYDLDRTLACREAYSGHFFQNLHDELLSDGKVSSVADDAYYRNLQDGVLYYENGTLVKRPPAPGSKAGLTEHKTDIK